MMEFFEFFFSGPNWGWKIFALILLVYSFGDVLVRFSANFFEYRLGKYIAENFDEIVEANDKDDTADANDVRS